MASKTTDKKATEALIQEIRERYTYASTEWDEPKEEGATDMRYVSQGPWSDKDLKEREDSGRPAMWADEIGQYTNQAINNFRQNQIGIKVNPAGNGATDQTASANQGLIRGIEYDSNAQRSAYTPAFENALQRSYGFFEITRKFIPKSFNQKIVIKGIPNPDVILYDPDVLEADWSDAQYVFKLSPLTKKEFKRKYPKAKVQDFSAEHLTDAKGWITEDSVLTAAYWKAEKVEKKLLLIETPEGQSAFYEDELPEGMKDKLKIVKERMDETREVTQYITNGVEILETLPQPGPYIPIIPVIGKEMYVPDSGGKSKRVLISLVRLARDPYMAYCYLWSQMAEEAKMTPKAPLIGYVGQFETDREALENLTSQPRSFVQIDAMVDAATGQVLPLPTRPQFSPNFPAYIQAMEAAKRAIQAAMGINPLPTAAQRRNEKSGKALDKIDQQESVGSFHFTDNIHRALEFAGRVIESWIPVVYDTEREVGMRKDDGTHNVVKINTPEPYADPQGQQQHFPVSDDGKPYGDHQIEITTGPSFQSQRDEANDFLNTIIPNIEQLPLDPALKSKFLALVIKMKNFGPLGDQMASLLDGTDPQQIQQQLGQLQQKTQQDQQTIQELQAELQKLQFEKAAKTVEMQGRAEIVKMQEENKLAIAEVSTKAQEISERLATFSDMMKQFHDQAHDTAKSAMEHQQTLEEGAQSHDHALQQGQQSGDQQAALAQQAQEAQASQPQGQ